MNAMPEKADTLPSLSAESVEGAILFLRGHKILLDVHLAALYGVPTGALMQAVKRNRERFPDDFMFQLSSDEVGNLKSQFVISS